MNQRLLTIAAIALIAATGASYVVYRTVVMKLTATSAATNSRVVVAARTLEVGTLIHEGDLKLSDWTGDIPRGAVSRKEGVVGRGVVSTVYEGEPVMESRLAPAGAGGGMAATIPPGMRACAVKVNDVVGVGGFVVPGMRVDVLVTGNLPGAPSTQGPKAKTVLQNVEVLSAGQNIQRDAEGRPIQVQVVNLLVSPEQAEILSLASNETRIQLVLRNPLDTNVSNTRGSSMSNLLGSEAAPPAPPKPVVRRVEVVQAKPLAPAPRVETPELVVEVYNGSSRTVKKFDEHGDETVDVSVGGRSR
jgi:pilus assembly protein CpaB